MKLDAQEILEQIMLHSIPNMKKGKLSDVQKHYKQAANDILERRLRVYRENEGLDQIERLLNG